jgi:hypothetical protein
LAASIRCDVWVVWIEWLRQRYRRRRSDQHPFDIFERDRAAFGRHGRGGGV